MISKLFSASSCLFAIVAFAPATGAEVLHYTGLCEASAASTLDDTHFVVASDDSTTLRVFETGMATAIEGGYDQPEVTDIEGAARIGETIFWITSHSLNKNGKDKDERKLLFATSIVDGHRLAVQGVAYRGLRGDIAKAVGSEDAQIRAEFNIEGLASTPDGSLLVGLRGPLSSGKPNHAYVVEISNPLALIENKAGVTADISDVHELKLFDDGETTGRGIRSIERAGDHYIIVAGSVLDSAEASRLYAWRPGDEGMLGRLADVSVDGPVPEALIAWSERDLQALGDNGDVVVGGEKCNDKRGEPPGAWFPSIRFDPGVSEE
jgi:hypothetical protein